MLKTEIKFGIITGTGLCLWILAEYLLGLHSTRMHIGEYTIYFSVIIPMVTIYLGLKEKRDKRLNGKFSFRSGIKAGLMISLIAAIITTLFLIFYFNYINPQYADIGVAFYKGKIIQSGKTAIQQTEELENIKRMFGFINQLLFGVIGTIGTGLIISAGVSYFLKKKHIVS